MESKLAQPVLAQTGEMKHEELAGAVLELIYTDQKIQGAIVDLVLSSPNIVLQF